MADAALQRKNMVESQVRPSDVTDRRITRAMLEVSRESFLPEASRALAYSDIDIPIAHAPLRTLMAPRTFAKLVQLAAPEAGDRVLVVGAGSGYAAVVLSRLAASVVALESNDALAATMNEALAAEGAQSVEVVKGPLPAGHVAGGPYDVILLEGSVPEVPGALLEQLRDGGRLVAIVASRGAAGKAVLWRRRGETVSESAGFDAGATPLPGFDQPKGFVF